MCGVLKTINIQTLNLVESGGIGELDIFEVDSSTDCTQCEATCLETGLSINSDVLEHPRS